MICTNCKKFFMRGNRRDGTPNGVDFMLKGGGKITMCADCLITLGKMDDQEKDQFFRELKAKQQKTQ